MLPITQVAIIGECMVELQRADGQVKQGFGGDTLNTAIYLSRLTHSRGITTAYVTGLGKIHSVKICSTHGSKKALTPVWLPFP